MREWEKVDGMNLGRLFPYFSMLLTRTLMSKKPLCSPNSGVVRGWGRKDRNCRREMEKSTYINHRMGRYVNKQYMKRD